VHLLPEEIRVQTERDNSFDEEAFDNNEDDGINDEYEEPYRQENRGSLNISSLISLYVFD